MRLVERVGDLRDLRHVDPPQNRHRPVALGADGGLERLPTQVARGLHRFLVRRLPTLDLGFARHAGLDDPVAHARDAVVLAFESQPFLRLVSLVAAASRVALRLRHLGDVDQGRLVLPPHLVDRIRVRLDQRRVIPAADDIDVDPRPVVWRETAQHVGDRRLRRLRSDRNGNSVPVVPHRHRERHLQHTTSVDRLPKESLTGRGVADGAEGDLVAVDRKAVLDALQLRIQAVELGRVGKADQPGHPAGDVRNVGARVRNVDSADKRAAVVEEPRREVVAHLASAGRGLRLQLGVAVELGEELAHVGHPGRPHERLVAVVAGAPVAGPKRLGHGDLRDLFAVTEDAERGVAAQDLRSADDARPTAAVRKPVVGDDGFGGQGELGVANGFRQLRPTSPTRA